MNTWKFNMDLSRLVFLQNEICDGTEKQSQSQLKLLPDFSTNYCVYDVIVYWASFRIHDVDMDPCNIGKLLCYSWLLRKTLGQDTHFVGARRCSNTQVSHYVLVNTGKKVTDSKRNKPAGIFWHRPVTWSAYDGYTGRLPVSVVPNEATTWKKGHKCAPLENVHFVCSRWLDMKIIARWFRLGARVLFIRMSDKSKVDTRSPGRAQCCPLALTPTVKGATVLDAEISLTNMKFNIETERQTNRWWRNSNIVSGVVSSEIRWRGGTWCQFCCHVRIAAFENATDVFPANRFQSRLTGRFVVKAEWSHAPSRHHLSSVVQEWGRGLPRQQHDSMRLLRFAATRSNGKKTFSLV